MSSSASSLRIFNASCLPLQKGRTLCRLMMMKIMVVVMKIMVVMMITMTMMIMLMIPIKKMALELKEGHMGVLLSKAVTLRSMMETIMMTIIMITVKIVMIMIPAALPKQWSTRTRPAIDAKVMHKKILL